MKAEVVVTTGEDTGRRHTLRPAQISVIGRSPEVAITIDDDEVSRRHCQLELRPEGGLYLTDMASSNGTYIAGRRLEPNTPYRVERGETIAVGTTLIRIAATGEEDDTKQVHTRQALRTVERLLPREEFEVLCRLGSGGAGQVYAARQKLAKRMVAVKFLHADTSEAKDRERFLREGQLCLKIRSPNVVAVHDIRTAGETVYLVMELINGESLAEALAEADAPLPIARVLSIAEQIAQGLTAVHAEGVIHRDVKPGNVLMTEAGVCKLSDFGLAKQLSRDLSQSDSDQGLGTLPYAAPEQITGQGVGLPTDLYGLGATLYHMIGGVPPFDARSGPKVFDAIANDPPPPVTTLRADCPAALAKLCHRLLEKEPEARPESAAAVLKQLNQLRMLHHAEAGASAEGTETQRMTAVPKHLFQPPGEQEG